MPIQHSDDTILKAMNRRGDSRQIRETIARVRTLIPDVTLRTSLITGFPGETKIRYNHLLDSSEKSDLITSVFLPIPGKREPLQPDGHPASPKKKSRRGETFSWKSRPLFLMKSIKP